MPLEARPDAKAALHLQYLTFKDLIASNDEILEVIADMEKKLEGKSIFGMAFVRSRCVTAASHTYRMIQHLNALSHRRHAELYSRFSDMQKVVERVLNRGQASGRGPLVLPIESVRLDLLEQVGGKSANLGEMRNRAGVPVPDGFCVTTDACIEFFDAAQLKDELRARLQGLDAQDMESASDISVSIHSLILEAALPSRLQAAIMNAYTDLVARLGHPPRVSLRSSALGEDGELSFAGQYVSVLNIPEEGILTAYKEVIAGLYTPRAICYRAIRGIPDEDVPMGVTCLTMVHSAASGVACSVDPSRPATRRMVINGAWGLGMGTVDGSVSPDTWTLSRENGIRVISSSAGSKENSVEPLASGGVGAATVTPELRSSFCLNDAQVEELARMVLAVERHYGAPQEVEWALDGEGRFFLLQTRPLHASTGSAELAPAPEDLEGHPMLLKGAPACAGCACGPAFLSFGPDDIHDFPAGGVLVARHSHPQYVRVMDRASAIVTDIGAPTGHMASLAREFGIPALLETRRATAVIGPGDVITVDGNRGAVYAGRIESLLAATRENEKGRMVGTPVHGILEEVSRVVVPLNLTDPRALDFQAQSCRTFHDIARFVHEKAFEAMFRISDRVSYKELRSVPLDVRLPFTVYLIDLGGGLARKPGSRRVTADDITSVPMAALLAGMSNPELRWWAPRALSLSGVASVTTQAIFTPFVEYGERELGDRSYAIVADAYCNFSSRIGYHFAAVDAYCTDSPGRNYISFRFKGGAADEVRRANRCVLIERILSRLDFQVERHGDLLTARIRKFGKETILDRLDMVGRVIVATRQLDMRMGTQTSVDWHLQAFFDGNYLFDPEFKPAAGPRGS